MSIIRNFTNARFNDHQFNLERLLAMPLDDEIDIFNCMAGAEAEPNVFEAITSANGKRHSGFTSNYTTDQAAAQQLLRLIQGGSLKERNLEFHVSMASIVLIDKKTPAASQAFWLHRLATPRPALKPVSMDAGRIEELLTKAGENLKFPSIVLADGDRTIKVAKAGQRSKYFGSITVAGERYGQGWYGTIKGGEFKPAKDCDDKITDLLTRFAADPAKVASEHGALTGSCCFCNKALKDERSTQVGYGSTCAKHYGLPWGA